MEDNHSNQNLPQDEKTRVFNAQGESFAAVRRALREGAARDINNSFLKRGMSPVEVERAKSPIKSEPSQD